MTSNDVPRDVTQVDDFMFLTCRKFRIFPSEFKDDANIRNRLATSSQLGVTIAVINRSKIAFFETKKITNYKVTRENMSVEVTDLPRKTCDFAGVSSINDIGVNSDGTLLAILHTADNDVSADIFDIRTICSAQNSGPFKPMTKIRVGTDSTNEGSALEWNPAFPDTLAASSTDRSILVVKIDVKNPNSQKFVGVGKLGAVTTAISWSPKGKQLTVGDSLGKVTQLKPELDVVRSQFGPERSLALGKVTGLCWLATTEWLVSFAVGAEHEAFLMRCKKDKPTEWIVYHELSYSSSKWLLPAQLFPATQLLIDWNVVLVGNTKTSEIVTIGKREEWTAWISVVGETIYLPTTENSKDSVATGLAIDLSQTEEVLLKPDGTLKHRPSPLVLCLTNDGVLTAHYVVSTYEPHKPCQITSENIPITCYTQLTVEIPVVSISPPRLSFQSPPVFESRPAVSTSTTTSTSTLASALAAKPMTPLFGSTPAALPSNVLSSEPTKPVSAVAPLTAAKAAPVEVPRTPVKKEEAPSTPPEPTTPPEVKRAEQLAQKKQSLIARIQNANVTVASTKEAVMKMSFGVGSAKASILECVEVMKATLADSKEVTDELKSLVSSIEWMAERTNHTVKEMDFEIEEKMEFVSKEEDGERILEKLRDMSETEKIMRFNKLETAADLLNGKFAECNEQIRKLRSALAEKETLRKQAVMSPLRTNSNLNQLRSGAETEVALKVMRNVSKIIVDTRERIQRTELEFIHFQKDVKAYTDASKKALNTTSSKKHADISILEEEGTPQKPNLTDAEIMKARNALVQKIKKRGPVKTKDVKVETFKKVVAAKKKEDPFDTANLSNAILKLSMTPRRGVGTSALFSPAPATSSVRRDATTQADEPPVIKTVVVTVESPARTTSTAPAVSIPVTKTTITASTSTMMTTPKFSLSKEEPKQSPAVASTPGPTTPAPTIFSGSLFGTKTSLPTPPAATKSSIFGSPLSVSSKESAEKNEKTPEKAKEELKQASKEIKQEVPQVALKETPKATSNETPKETPNESPKVTESAPSKTEENKVEKPAVETPKVEEKAAEPVAPAEQKVPEEKKEESTTKPPSFSFNTPTTQQTAKPASSIFGGGLKAQETPTAAANTSSIFGAAAKSSPSTSGATPSIFGGGTKTGSSPFGSFGQGVSQPAQAAAPSAGAVSFSFNTAAATAAPAKPSFGSFGAPASTAKPSSVFGAAAASASPAVPNVDDGMEDDSMGNAGGAGGFMSGLGSSRNTSNTSSNPFAPKTATGSSASSSWLFGGGAGGNQPAKPSFSFSNAATSSQPQASSSPSNTSSVFGGAPKFGSQPVFGAKPFGGGAATTGGAGLSKNASIFGAAAAPSSSSSGGGFAQFAKGQPTSSLFGGAVSGAQPNTSIFGGGAAPPAAPTSSIFGGGTTANSNKPTSFTSWR